MTGKRFFLPADRIRPDLAPNYGGCLATDEITVRGLPVGYMHREMPADRLDSGWRFFAGTESQDYLAEPSHSAVYDVNTIANYSPDIVDWLMAPPGAAFERAEDGLLKPTELSSTRNEGS